MIGFFRAIMLAVASRTDLTFGLYPGRWRSNLRCRWHTSLRLGFEFRKSVSIVPYGRFLPWDPSHAEPHTRSEALPSSRPSDIQSSLSYPPPETGSPI